MFQHSCSEIGSIRKQVLINLNIIKTQVWKTVTRLCHTKNKGKAKSPFLLTCVSIMLKCTSMHLIEIYHATQEL